MKPHHVYPTWESHDTDHGPDCWCEPTVEENGLLIIHHARTCTSESGRHDFKGTKVCVHCTQEYGHTFDERKIEADWTGKEEA